MDTKPDVILFDMDGTLLENGEHVADAYYTGLQHLNYPLLPKEYISTLQGLSSYDTGRALNIPEEDLHLIDAWFWDYFTKYSLDDTKHPEVFPDVEGILKKCNELNIKIAIVTSNQTAIAQRLFEKVNLHHYFNVIVGSDLVENPKPHAEPLLLALEKLEADIENDKIWMVGDSSSDIGAAKNAGVTSIAIPQSFTVEKVMKVGPDFVVESITELLNHLSAFE
eukprot:TRINITY_DN11678_c0_g1_i1.p1 TRINITY_DN11678_c0_g1~~TRINITY_DN11678_c0_g1_i1.p1  ORF type:complete len:223 (+),score=51.46 TRINITY_DN11678_c0_g1_i1:272-940(+)